MITQSEKRWITITAAVLLVISSIPYLLGYWSQGSAWVFSGFIFGVEDGNSYIAKMLSGAAGAWLFRSPYTAYPQPGMLAFLPYILLGKLTSGVGQHEQLVALFHLFRLAAGFFMFWVTYQFVSQFTKDLALRRLGTCLTVFGGGLGWLAIAGLQSVFHNGLPLEFYSPETFGFLSFWGLPHLAIARGLLLLGILIYLRPGKPTQLGLRGGAAWLLLGLMQPLTVLVGWAVIAAHLFFMGVWIYFKRNQAGSLSWDWWKKRFLTAAGIVIVSSPMVIYTGLAFQNDTFLSVWQKQNIITSPPPLDYLLGYLPVLPLVILTAFQTIKKGKSENMILISWVFLIPFLAYFPYNLQRRLPEGSWAAMVGLAMIGMGYFSGRKRTWIYRGLTSCFLPALILFAGGVFEAMNPQQPLFIPKGEVNAYIALQSYAVPGDIVLGSFDTSNQIPAWAPVRTIIGHGPESIHLAEIQPRVDNFYAGKLSEEEEIRLIQEFHVKYVFWGPNEKKLAGDYFNQGNHWDPPWGSLFYSIYHQGQISIFKVGPEILDAKK